MEISTFSERLPKEEPIAVWTTTGLDISAWYPLVIQSGELVIRSNPFDSDGILPHPDWRWFYVSDLSIKN